MINFDDVAKEKLKEHNPNWPQIPDHPCRTIIIGGSGSGKTNSLFHLINEEPDEQINKRKSTGLKDFNDYKAFTEYSNDMNDIYKNIEKYNPNKKRKTLMIFHNVIADMRSNKKIPIVQ